LAQERVVNRTVDGGVQQDVQTKRDVDAATPDLNGTHQLAAAARPETQETLHAKAASQQLIVGDIPAEPPGFRLRAGQLAELDRAGVRVTVIHAGTGLHGLGTTHLAAAYARAKLEAGWRLVAWINGADTGSLLAGLAAVADATGLADDDSGPDSTDAAGTVRHWLETDGDRCLLVFDDVPDPELLQAFIPAHGSARVLITSPRQPAANTGSAVPADVFSAAEASAFLAARTGLDDEAWAAAVAAELGYRPLALALAAPVIRGQRHGYARYLDRLQTIPIEVSPAGDDQRYPHGLVRAVLLALAAMRAADRTGMCTRITQIVAVLSAAGIRRELLHVAGRAGVLAGGGRRVEASLVDRVLDWLSDRSLLTLSLDGQTVVMHHLVAQVIRDGLTRRRRLGAVCWVAASVLEAYAISVAGSEDRPGVRGIPLQVTALLGNTAELAWDADEDLAEILLRLRFIALYHLIELGDSVPQAIAVGEPLTADLERSLGPGHPDTLNARNSLAAAYLAADRVADAIALFEQTLAVLQREHGPDHPDTLTSQNNLASAYQDAGRVAEAIQLYELNLAARERLLGADHPGTLNFQGNLAVGYLAAGRVAEAIPLLERTLAGRERVLGPDHPDTQTSRRNLAKAYQEAGRAAEAIPLLERASAGRQQVLRPDRPRTQISRQKLAIGYRGEERVTEPMPPGEQTRESQESADAAARGLPVGFRRPPTDAARPALPGGFRRPPADLAGRLPSDHVNGLVAGLSGLSSPSRARYAPVEDTVPDHEVVAAIMAGDPAGIVLAYDRYASALYGYCHWRLRDPADAAESLQDTFVLAAAMLSKLPEHAKLRPWLFALARNECRRRIRPGSAPRDEADAASQQADGNGQTDATTQSHAAREPADVTIQFRAVGEPADVTMQFGLVGEPADVTMQFGLVGQLADATMQFSLVRKPDDATDSLADVNGFLGQAELRALIRAILADMKPREREVVELSFRHDMQEDDLATALGLSSSQAHALAARTRGRVEKSFGALRTALAGRQACPVMGELLADWDGQLTEQTRDLVAWHIEQCQICVNDARGALRPTVLSGLLPLAPLPPELRERVLSRCSSTSEDAVAYRRRVIRRAESTWAARFSQAIRWASWDGIQAYPGVAIATTAVAVWAAMAVIVMLLTFAGSRAAHAQTAGTAGSYAKHAPVAQAAGGISSSSPSAAPVRAATTTAAATTAATPTSAAARPSPAVTGPSAYMPSQAQLSPSLGGSNSPSKSPSPSRSPKPSKTPSKSPSPSASPSSSTSPSTSPSPSPSPTA
jgi:RNA polymerase sigma factor (sigma-70 family)